MKLGIVTLLTKDLSISQIENINALKNQHWVHEKAEHMIWFNENIESDDVHLMIRRENQLLGYLNILDIQVFINRRTYRLCGIGNVCVDIENQNRGIGQLLMSSANAYIRSKNTCGLLLCHSEHLEFYRKSNWRKLQYMNAIIGNRPFKLFIMSYDPFHILPNRINMISIERNF